MSGTSQSPLQAVALNDVTPESVDSAEVRAALDAERAPVRQRGAQVCQTLAAADVDAVRPVVGPLGAALHDDDPGVARTAAAALIEVATADPDAVVPILDDAAVLADSALGGVQMTGARLLATVAQQRPKQCTAVVEPLLDRLARPPSHTDGQSVSACVDDRITRRAVRQHEQGERDHEQVARQVFANVVVAVAEADPPAVADHVEAVADLATGEGPVVRGAALDVLTAVAQERPQAVSPVTDGVVACLDADERVLRARAIRVLGYLEQECHAGRLSAVAETDPDDGVAALARETAAFLDT